MGIGSINIWDGTNGRRLSSFDVPFTNGGWDRAAQSPDGRYAMTFQEQGILWDVPARKQHTFQVPFGNQDNFAFSPDSSLLATCSNQQTKTIRIWDLNKGRQLATFKDEKAGWQGFLFFSGDAKTLYVVGHHVIGYDVASGKEFCSWRLAPLPSNGVKVEAVGGCAKQICPVYQIGVA